MRSRRLWAGLALFALAAALFALPTHYEFTGLTLAGCGFLCLADWWTARRGWPRGWHAVWIAVGAVVLTVLAAGTAYILSQGRSDWAAARQADYAIVLGAQVRQGQPSRTLRERLELAAAFLEENPTALVIVSGGQGADESVTEADAMYDYLAARGADVSRVYREPLARDTRENLENSAALAARLGLDPGRPVVITSEFHLCRARYIAASLGLDPIPLGSATPHWYYRLNCALREVFAFAKAWYHTISE